MLTPRSLPGDGMVHRLILWSPSHEDEDALSILRRTTAFTPSSETNRYLAAKRGQMNRETADGDAIKKLN
jgi:hypothetical protein